MHRHAAAVFVVGLCLGVRSSAQRSGPGPVWPALSASQRTEVVGLADKYRLTPDDLLTSDLHLVPAAMPVDVGLDGQSARLGWGLVFKEYGSGREADSKYFARVRRLFDEAGVPWQTHAYQAGYGGGTTA